MDYFQGIPIIDDSTPGDFTHDSRYARGAVPRDFSVQPPEMMASADDVVLIPDNDLDGWWEKQEAEQSGLDQVVIRARARGRFKDRYQNGDPLCWAHSTTHGIMVANEVANKPPVTLSAYMLACLSDGRGYANSGAWGALSAQTAQQIGICSDAKWPQGQRSRSLDTPAMREEAKLNLVTGVFADLGRPVWAQNVPFKAVLSCLFTGRPVVVDFNWWSHSVLALKAVRIAAGDWGILILNSWGLDWGQAGMSILRESKAKPDGSVVINTVRKTVSAVSAPAESPLAV